MLLLGVVMVYSSVLLVLVYSYIVCVCCSACYKQVQSFTRLLACCVCVGAGVKVVRCCCSSVLLVGWLVVDRLVLVLVEKVEKLRNERTHSHVLPKVKRPISDTILTDTHTLTIHITVYFILDSLTI